MVFRNGYNISRWQHDLTIFQSLFRNTTYAIDSEGFWMQGDLYVEASTGREVGPFTLKIIFEDNYFAGKMAPSTFLISHRGTWKALGDAHIENNWKLCLFVYFESNIDFSKFESFRMYLESLSSFMLDQCLYQEEVKKVGRRNAKWPGPQRSHNMKGYIEALLANIKSPQSKCPCGSGKKFSQCHKLSLDRYVEKEIFRVGKR